MKALQSVTALEKCGPSEQCASPLFSTPYHHHSNEISSGGKPAATTARTVEGAGLAHDAGNLLGALSLYSDLLALPGVLSDEYREYAKELKLLSERSWALIDRLINHAESAHGPTLVTESTVLPEVVDRCRGLLSKVVGRKVEISFGERAFQPVNVSAEAIERILTNLVKNAAEATPKEGVISVRVEGHADGCKTCCEGGRQRIVMTVRDNGCGMSNADVRKLQRSVSVPYAGGRGLGIRVVRELLAMSGGCLNIDSQLGVGTVASVEWYEMTNTVSEKGCVPGRCPCKTKPERQAARDTVGLSGRRINDSKKTGGIPAKRAVAMAS